MMVRTKSTYFLLPLTGVDKGLISPFLNNCYIQDIDLGYEKLQLGLDHEYLFVLLDIEDSTEFKEAEKSLQGNVNFKLAYNIGENHCMYVFTIPNLYKEDVKAFLRGAYSEMSKAAKDRILNGRTNNTLYKVFTKDASLRKHWEYKTGELLPNNAEVWPKPSFEEEVFTRKLIENASIQDIT